jgi:AcrR family transcriptional regulator
MDKYEPVGYVSSAKEMSGMKRNSAHRISEESGSKLARDRVFEVAADLFYRKGVRAVGVEAIVNQAGVAKISLYRSFPSKDDLVVAYLENRDAMFWRQWDKAFDRYKDDPHAQLHAIMRYLAERTGQPGYRGCPFINYCAEFPDPAHPGHRVAKANKREMRRRFLQIAESLGAREPKQLADGLLLLVEGAYAISQTLGGAKGAGNAIVWAAKALVEAQRRTTRSRP